MNLIFVMLLMSYKGCLMVVLLHLGQVWSSSYSFAMSHVEIKAMFDEAVSKFCHPFFVACTFILSFSQGIRSSANNNSSFSYHMAPL